MKKDDGCFSDVEMIICERHGELFEYIAKKYTYQSFLSFARLFMMSDFCRRAWDAKYSRYQFHDPEENMDFFMKEIDKDSLAEAKDGDEQMNASVAAWIGFAYRSLCIVSKLPSREIYKRLPVEKMIALYPGMHTLDEYMAAEIILQEIGERQ